MTAFQPSLSELRRSFLESGSRDAAGILGILPEIADRERAHSLAHRWKGLGATLGVPEISELAARMETLLEEPGLSADLLPVVEGLARAFSRFQSEDSCARVLPPALAHSLSGKRFALLGFRDEHARRLVSVLEGQAGGFARSRPLPDGEAAFDRLRSFDVIILRIGSEWPACAEGLRELPLPTLLVGSGDTLIRLGPSIDFDKQDFVSEPCDSDELVLRVWFLLSKYANRSAASGGIASQESPRIVIADDDLTIAALVRNALQNCGMECLMAADGLQALFAVREARPQVAILDVNMPKMDGFEVLSAIRADGQVAATHVILLTARQHETDVIRGFSLGADDYITKPFSPVELVARLRRLLRSRP